MNFLLSSMQHKEMARDLHQAALSGNGTEPPSNSVSFTMDDAYIIRRFLVDMLIADGGVPKGHKIGFTSQAMQEMYGMSGPDFGQLLDNMFVNEGQPIAISKMSDTRVEPEVAFIMKSALRGPNVTKEDVLAATEYVCASVEVIDSRVGAMRATAVDSIADNAGAGRVVLSERRFAPQDVDFATVKVRLDVDGDIQEAAVNDVMDHPANAVAWLANRLSEIGDLGGQIEAGDVIMSGSPTRSVAVAPGAALDADFGPLGRLVIKFT